MRRPTKAAPKQKRSRTKTQPAKPRAHLAVVDRGRPRSDLARLRRVAAAALEVGGRPGMAVSLLLTGDKEIGELHSQFLGDPTPTDVISFELDGAAEIVVSVDTAKRCAKERGHAWADEVALYVAHGILHICGFDDIAKKDRVKMRAAERRVMTMLGIAIDDVDA